MSNNYTPHEFQRNTILTAQALNEMDNQIGANSETLAELDELYAILGRHTETIAANTTSIAESVAALSGSNIGGSNVDLTPIYETLEEHASTISTNSSRIGTNSSMLAEHKRLLDSIGATNLSQLSTQVEENKSNILGHAETLRAHNTRISKNEEEIAKLKNSSNTGSGGTVDLTEVNGRLDQHDNEINTNASNITNIFNTLDRHKQSIDSNYAAIQGINTEGISTIKNDVNTLKTTSSTHTEEISNIKNDVNTLKSTSSTHTEEISNINSTVDGHTAAINEIQEFLLGVDPDTGEITDAAIAALRSELKGDIQANTASIQANTTNIAKNSTDIATNTSNIATINSDLNGETGIKSQLTKINSDLESVTQEVHNNYSTIGSTIGRMNSDITSANNNIKTLQDQMSENADAHGNFEQRLEEHGNRISDLETNIVSKQDKFSLKIDDSEVAPINGILDITTTLEDKIEELVGDTNNSGVSETTVKNIMQESGFYDNEIELRNNDEEISFKVNGDKQVIEDISNISYNSNNYISSDSAKFRLYSTGTDKFMNGTDTEILFKSFSHSGEPTSISKFNNSIFRIKNIQSAFMLSTTVTGTLPGTSTTKYLNCFDYYKPETNQTTRRNVWNFEFFNENNTIGVKVKLTYEDGTVRDIIFGGQMGDAHYDENIFTGITYSNVQSGTFNKTWIWQKSKNSKSVNVDRISKASEVGKLFNYRNILLGNTTNVIPDITDTTNYNAYIFDFTGNSRINSLDGIELGFNIDIQYLHENYSDNKQIKSVEIYFIIPSGTLRYYNDTNYITLPTNTEYKIKGIFNYDIVRSEHDKVSQDCINIYKDGLVIKKGSTTFISSNDNGGYTEMKCESPYKTESGESLFYGIKVTPSGIEICPGNREYQSLAGYIVWCANQAISSYDNHTRGDSGTGSEPDSGTGSEPDSGTGSGSVGSTGIGTDFVGTGDIIKNRVENMDLYEDILGKLDDHDEADNDKYYYDDSLDFNTHDPSWML